MPFILKRSYYIIILKYLLESISSVYIKDVKKIILNQEWIWIRNLKVTGKIKIQKM